MSERSSNTRWLDFILILSMGILALWIATQFGILDNQLAKSIADAYFGMAVIAFIVAGLARANVGFLKFEGLRDISEVNILGQRVNGIAFYFILGAILGYLISYSGRLTISRLIEGSGAIGLSPELVFAFAIILAPIVEELFFRAALFPSFEKFLAGKTQNRIYATIGAAVIVSLLFGVWHLAVSGGSEQKLIGEVLYSLIQIGMLRLSGTIIMPIGSHVVRNTAEFVLGGI